MDNRIQFRVDEDTKKLAQVAAVRLGTTLSDECRKLTEKLAREQKEIENHDSWLVDEINKAYEQFLSGESKFVSDNHADEIMNKKKQAIRKKYA